MPATFFGPALAAPRSTPGVIDPPTVTLGVPATALIGTAAVPFTVTFDNNDPEGEAGYGPFLELQIPRTGADGDDGLGTTTITAAYMGASIPAGDFYRTTFNAGGTATDPIVRDATGNFITVSGTPGDELVDIRLPFGSFSAGQPPAVIQMTVNLSNLADLDYPLTIRARGGYEFGFTPLDDWCCGDAASTTLSGYTSASVTPTLLTLSKTYTGPANTSPETATGPNNARQYTVSADIPAGQTITDLTLTDLLPDNMEYLSIVSATPAGYIVDDQPTLGAAQNTPNNDLVVRWPTVTGGAGATDAAVTFSFFIPGDDANGLSVIDPALGTAVSSCNNARVSGSWTPIDPRDPTQLTTTDPTGCEHTLIDRSLAIQKSVANITDGVNSPGDVMDYTLEFQISDFFAFDQVTVTDVLSDGQHFDPSFVPTLAVDGNGYSLGTADFNSGNYTVDVSMIDLTDGPPHPPPENSATDGTTKLIFRVSDEIVTRGQNGGMIGGCVNPVTGSPHPDCSYNDGGTTAVIHFHSIIQDNFTDNYPSGDWSVDQGDVFQDRVTVAGRLLDTGTFAPGGTVTDDAAAGFNIPTGALSKSIYAINDSTSFASPPRIAPGDKVTYRITYVMPTSDEERLAFADYLPLPIFFVADPDANDYNTLPPAGAHNDGPAWVFNAVGQSGQPSVVIPAAGSANFGPSDTFYTYSTIVPTLSADVANNRLDFYYGNFDDPRNLSRTVDILFSVVVAAEPFADQMYLTNQAHAIEGSTNAGPVASDSIVQLILTEPVLRSTKGVVYTSNTRNIFTPPNLGPAGVTFLAPGSAPRWTGTINSSGLAARPINSDVRDVDAGDTVTFAITVENTGTSLKGAFDIRIADVLQPEYQIPATGLNLQVYYGNRTGPISYHGLTSGCLAVGNNNTCGEELFQAGIELVDPVGAGVCQAHDPNSGNNVILITYDLQIRTIVSPGNVINTETLLHYAGEEGGPNHVPTPSPYTDQATVTISGAPAKYIVNTSEPSTVFSGVEQVTIGEIIRYRIVARIPESTILNYQLRDLVPNGLIFLNDGTARIGLISNGGIVSAGRDSIPAIPGACDLVGTAADATTPATLPCLLNDWNIGSTDSTTANNDVYASGTDIYFKLGDLTNPDLDDDGEYAVIEFNALVHNETTDQNNSGANRDNGVRTYAGVPSVQFGSDSPAVSVRIVEPFLTLAKTHSAMSGTVDAGDVVTYTATITNDGNAPTNSTATAFDVDFTDTPPAAYLTLDLASITATTSGGVTGVVNGSTGNTVHFVIGSMPVGSQVILTYQVTVTNNVTPGQAIANTGAVVWTSLPGPHGTGDQTPGAPGTGTGERDGSNGPTGNPNHYDRLAVATLNIRAPIFSKTLQGTSAGHTAGNALAVGEAATFGLMVTLPEGTTPSLQVLDDLPNGLAYVPGSMQLVTQTNPPATCGNLAADFNGTVPLPTLTISPPGGSGANLTFDFTAITVTADNVSNNNSFLVCFDAVLLNETGNQASSPPLTNIGSLIVGFNTFISSQSVTVVEPVLRIAKSVDDPNPTPGQVVTFTVVVDHAGSSTATAFDAVIFDTLPSDLTLDLSSVGVTASGGLTGVVNGSTGNQISFSVAAFPIGGSLTLTYRATVNAPFGTTVNNTATVTWTSLPGVDANERTGADGVGGPLNDYAASSNAPLITNRNLTKTLLGDSFPDPVTTLPDVAIGEILTYELVLTVPPASTGTYTVTDTLDPGLAFVDCADITAGAGLASSKVNLHAAGNCDDGTGSGNNPLITNSGATVAFDFGTVTNSDSTNPESITIRYQAVVLDIAANVRGVSLSNSATMQWATGHITRQTLPVRIIESDLGLEKSVDHSMAAPGMPLIYRVRIFHTGTSQLDAYDVSINDILPEGVVYVPGSLSFVTGSGTPPNLLDDTGIDPGTGRPIIHAFWNTLALGEESTIEFMADFGNNLPGTNIVNTAGAEWTSLPGLVPAPPAIYLSFYNQPFSHERRYDPLNPADIYRVTSAVTVTALSLPETGFAPDRVTSLPPQRSDKRYAYLGGLLLEIPKLNQNLPVVGVPITTSGWDLTWLWDQAGYLTGTAYPGSAGNSVITAHVYLSNGLPGPFVNLGTLGWGDRIILLGGGQRFIYEVRENKRVLPTDITPFRHEENPWLTLVTCQDYNRFRNTYLYRTVVRAVLIDIEGGS